MVYTRTSKEMRTNPFFLRNQFQVIGRWGIPVMQICIRGGNLRVLLIVVGVVLIGRVRA